MISLFWLFNHFYQNAYNAKSKGITGNNGKEKSKEQ